MKKVYQPPTAELVRFRYREQVVAASGETCINQYTHDGNTSCDNWIYIRNYLG